MKLHKHLWQTALYIPLAWTLTKDFPISSGLTEVPKIEHGHCGDDNKNVASYVGANTVTSDTAPSEAKASKG